MDSSLDKGKRSRIFTFLASATGRLRKRPPTEEEANGKPEPPTLWLGPCLISPFQESEQLAADASCYQEGSASGKWPTFEWSKAHRLHDIQSLCDACDKIDVSALIKRGSSIRLHNSLTALDRAARNCTLCSLICQSVRGVSGSRYEKDFLSTMGSRDARDSDSIPVYMEAHDGMLHVAAPFPEDWKGYGDQNGWHLGSFPIHHREEISTIPPPSAYDSGSTSSSKPPGTWVPIKKLSQNTACDDGNSLLNRLRTQLNDVLASSCETCMPTRTKSRQYGRLPLPTLPDRVIQILDSSTADAIELNLYITPGTIKGHYVALSHRWGGQMTFKTTKNTLNQRLRGFALTELPRTFQDAVLVARALDIKFIWIDCLCIVQDDHRDWLQQSSKMGTIYRNAAYTIAAHSARQCNEGFLWRCQVPATLCINPRRGGPEFFVSIPDLQIQQIHRHFF
ncbi:hypothetical protein NM208_g6892 [Fusarium decemcellulare]|uniref:Uncharacterized protein n=1 Tax=Fusarium decemcellulare TaxID=57161 RepID=A0ACC1SBB5_9HYPO|nr:hypothetical protein NM208_g6892 [Fusarium decemcellulare]